MANSPPAVDDEHTPPPPSFEGRLKLQDFLFTPTKAAGTMSASIVRRSPRLTGLNGGAGSSSVDSASAGRLTPQKRRALSAPSAEPDDAVAAALSAPTPASSPPLKKARTTGGSVSSTTPKSKQKRQRQKSGYAPPSVYAHLPELPDAILPNLILLFVGLNPGVETARSGHAYAHPSNLFWKLLASSGITPRLLSPTEDRTMPERYALGNTNIVSRPSRNGAELSRQEMDDGVATLETKARRWRPEAVCIVGKSIWESVWRVRHGRSMAKGEFRYGWQDERENMGVGDPTEDEGGREPGVDYTGEWKGARVFVATSTSGLAASLRPAEKEAIWRELGVWVEQRRAERQTAQAEP